MNSLQPSPLYKREYEHDACGVGFLANINGERSHGLLKKTIQALKNLAHRGAIDADAITGDGAGILTQIPYPLFRDFLQEKGKNLYNDDDLGVGTIFLPRDDEYAQSHAKQIVETAVKDERLSVLGWREVPVDDSCLGQKAKETQPKILQILTAKTNDLDPSSYERKLFLAQKSAERKALEQGIE